MNLDSILKVGEVIEKEFVAKRDDSADYIGNDGVTVLSTPAMIKYIEQTAAGFVLDRVPENYRPVGTRIDINHINPTPINAKFIVKAIITEIKGSKVSYDVKVYNEKFTIGTGTYELHVINLNRFLDKL